MQAIILAAGRGSRLGMQPYPKALTLLDDKWTILGWQIHCLKELIPFSSITVVVGYQYGLIAQAHPFLHLVLNDNFANENTAKSLLRGLESTEMDDVLWLNGDVVFHPSVLTKLIAADATAMLVNRDRVAEEEVKYRVDRHGFISEVSKEVVNGEGEALGINFVKRKDKMLLMKKLEGCADNDYFEKGIENGIKKGLKVAPVEVAQNLCIEVDFPDDLERAKQLFKSDLSI